MTAVDRDALVQRFMAAVTTDEIIPDRPVGAPEGARYFPPADDFSALKEHNRTRSDQRSYLRVAFPFLFWTVRGPLLYTLHRALAVRPTRFGEAKVWLFERDKPVPGVWAWTLDDERAIATPHTALAALREHTGDTKEQ